jgi:NDP-sugar pyrophosphorylase family protein
MPHNNKLTLVVLAAGIGSRYGGLKQVDPVGPSGELIIDYSIYDALQAGFDRVVFVISHAIEQTFRERIGRNIERQVDTDYVFQNLNDLPAGFDLPEGRVKPWGTAHATWCARSAVGSPFAVINADDFYGRGAYRAIAGHLAGSPEYCLVGYQLGNTLTEFGHVARGVCAVDAAGNLQQVVERTHIEGKPGGAHYTEDGSTWVDLPLDSTVSMNCWGFTPGLFDELGARFPRFLQASRDNILKAEFFLPSVVSDLVQEGRTQVKVLKTAERWYGMTYAQDKQRVKAALQGLVKSRIYPEKLWRG